LYTIPGVFPNKFKKRDTNFAAVFYNSLTYPVELYGINFEGIKHQHTKVLEPGSTRTEDTTLTTPWVFKRSNDSVRLRAFVRNLNGSVFKGEIFGAKQSSKIHIIISDNGNYTSVFTMNYVI
jgi:hypothetical protein